MRLNFLATLYMSSYAAQYGCGSNATHTCHDCPDGRVSEFARTRRSGWITEGYLPTIMANPTDLTAWQTGITAGKIIIVPETNGSYDPGTPKELKGFGDRKKSNGPRTMKVSINDPDYADNYHFYNEIKDRTDLVPFFVTSSLIHIFDKTASIIASDPVADDIEEEIFWQVVSEVTSDNLPSKHKVATILPVFTCPTF